MSSPKLSSRRLWLLSGFLLLGSLGAASVCSADSPLRRRAARPAASPYRVALEALDGSSLPTFQQSRTRYVLGEPGARYNIRVTNPTGERVEVVVSVDGRDAISGQPGDYSSQRGYLVEPWGSLLVEGFRRSLDEVAAFRFTDHGRSYSALRGTPENVGVIGVAVFPEKARPPAPIRRPRRPYFRDGRESRSAEPGSSRGADGAAKDKHAGAPAAAPAPRAEGSRSARREQYRADDEALPERSRSGPSNIGTQYGEGHASSVVEVAFERRAPTQPASLLLLRYDDYEGLTARGIDLSSHGYASYAGEPQPFPRSRFAPAPHEY